MWRFIIVTFSFLAFAFYQLSGGASYQPREGSRQDVAMKALQVSPVAQTKLAAVVKSSALVAQPDAVVTRASLALEELPRVTATKSVMVPQKATEPALKPAADAFSLASLSTTKSESVAEPAKDIRQITGSRVNMRMGPGTKFDVVTKLSEGTEVEVLQAPGEGWLKLRVTETGRVGWMADYLVTAAN